MGFPLSRFEQLSALSDGNVSTNFESFKLVAIVLHDYNDDSFRNKMIDLFVELDHLTGKNFLFVTFIDPPRSWNAINIGIEQQSMRNLSAEQGMDDIVVLSKLKKAFHLEYQKLPVILLTDNLTGKDFFVLNTSENKIKDQLVEIGRFCDQQKEHPSLTDDSMKNLLRNLGGAMDVHIDVPISNIINEVDAERGVGDLDEKFNFSSKLNKLKWLKIKLNLALSILNNCCTEIKSRNPNAIDENIWTKYDEAVQKMADCLPALSGAEYIDLHNPPLNHKRRRFPIGEKIWENHTYRNASGCQRENLYPIISMNEYPGCEVETAALEVQYGAIASGNGFLSGSDISMEMNRTYQKVKYTTMTYCLGKMFEIEMERSIVQMMREVLGVTMPTYFCAYQDGVECIIQSENNINVNLNDRFGYKWKAPSLGQSFYAYNYLQAQRMAGFEYWGNSFVNLWKWMNGWRNRADHTGMINEDGIKKVQITFVQLQNNYFQQMMELKMRLKNAQ